MNLALQESSAKLWFFMFMKLAPLVGGRFFVFFVSVVRIYIYTYHSFIQLALRTHVLPPGRASVLSDHVGVYRKK